MLDSPRKRLRWLSPLTPTTLNTSSPASSSSQNASRSKRWSKQTITPNVPTATASAKPPNAANRSTPHASIACFIILGRLTHARTQPAPKEDTRNPSPPAARPRPPTAPTAAATMMPSPEIARPGLSGLYAKSPRPTPTTRKPLPSTVKATWRCTGMARQHPLLPRPLGPTLST